MAKNPENVNPFHEEEYEEQERLYGKDKLHAYITPEQLPDITEQEEGEQETDPVHESTDISDQERAKIADKKRIELLNKELQYSQSDGVASVGPDVIGVPSSEPEEASSYQVSGERESMAAGLAEPIYHMNKKARRPEKAVGHENLKTLSEQKKSKTLREKIRDFFTKQNYKETDAHRIEDQFVDNYEDEGAVVLNGRPMDKNLSNEFEDDKAA